MPGKCGAWGLTGMMLPCAWNVRGFGVNVWVRNSNIRDIFSEIEDVFWNVEDIFFDAEVIFLNVGDIFFAVEVIFFDAADIFFGVEDIF